MNMIKALLKDIIRYLPARMIPGIVGLIFIPIVTRLFAPADYAYYVLVVSTVAVLVAVANWVSLSIVRFYPEYEREDKVGEFCGKMVVLNVFTIILLVGVFLAGLFLVRDHISGGLFCLMALGTLVFILTSVFETFQHFLRVRRQVNSYSAFAVWKSISAVVLGIFLVVFFRLGVKGLLFGVILGLIAALPFLWKKVKRNDAWDIGGTSFLFTLKMARYSLPLVLANLSAWILSLSDRYILQFFRGSTEVGIYSASYGISEKSILLLTSVFMLASGPLGISVWEKSGMEKSQRFVTKLSRYYLILCLPAVIGLSVLAKPLLRVLVARDYYEGYRIVLLISLGGFFMGLQHRFQLGLIFRKKTGYIMTAIIAAGLLNILLNVLLIPSHGYMAAALTTLVSYVFLLALMVFFSRAYFVWKFPFKSLLKVLFASAVMGVVIYPIGKGATPFPAVNLMLGVIVGSAVYLVALFVAKEPSTQELDTLRGMREGLRKKVLTPVGVIARFSGKSFSEMKEKIISAADKACDHVFDLLGSGDTELGKRIDWHTDFKTGYRWDPDEHYKKIKIPYGKADIKVPWELSRFQHLSEMGMAYAITGNGKYAEEFGGQVEDWIGANRPGHGVNWSCAMDVAIRACNWMLGYSYFRGSEALTPRFRTVFLESMEEHGRHIMGNLERRGRVISNHYLSDIAGLLFIGTMFPEFRSAGKWKKFAIKEFVKEIERQVYDDGCDFEASTCYHRLVLEIFFFSALLMVKNDTDFDGKNHREVSEKIFGKRYVDKLYRMFDAVCHLLKPDGRMPQIGDNDSGQFFKLYPREVLDMRYLLALGGVFFGEKKWKVREFFGTEEDIAEILICYGEEGRRVWDSLEWNSLAGIGSKAFPDTGWYVMRRDKNYCLVSCGPNGLNGRGGHAHNDKLSFELCLNGKDVIVDPGTYLYTVDPGKRNMFRSTAYHNTVMVKGEEQNRIDVKDPFFMKDETVAECTAWENGEDTDVFAGRHYGYKRLSHPVVHERRMVFHKKKGRLEVEDTFHGEGEWDLDFNLILSPDHQRDLYVRSERLAWKTRECEYSPGYGIIRRTGKYTAVGKAKDRSRFEFVIGGGPHEM